MKRAEKSNLFKLFNENKATDESGMIAEYIKALEERDSDVLE